MTEEELNTPWKECKHVMGELDPYEKQAALEGVHIRGYEDEERYIMYAECQAAFDSTTIIRKLIKGIYEQ